MVPRFAPELPQLNYAQLRSRWKESTTRRWLPLLQERRETRRCTVVSKLEKASDRAQVAIASRRGLSSAQRVGGEAQGSLTVDTGRSAFARLGKTRSGEVEVARSREPIRGQLDVAGCRHRDECVVAGSCATRPGHQHLPQAPRDERSKLSDVKNLVRR